MKTDILNMSNICVIYYITHVTSSISVSKCFKLTNHAIRFRLREQSRVKPIRIEKIGYTTEYTRI